MNMRFPFEETSIWVSEPADLEPELAGDQTADVVIVGGGYAGLSTAIELKKRGVDVVLLEKDFCGAGASGRNAGHLSPAIGKDIPSLLKMFGKQRAKELVEYAESAIAHTENVIKEHDIDCDYVQSGTLIATLHKSQEKNLKKAADAAADLGLPATWLDNDHLRQRRIPKAFKSGMFEDIGGILHPGKYVLGLRRAALQAGVRVFENSAMTRMDEGTKPVVYTAKGSVTADTMVQTTNAYTNSTGRLKRLVMPLRVTLFETEPLSDAQMDALGWQGQEGIYTAHEFLENFRLTKHRTLIGGSKIVRYKFSGGFAEGYHEPTFERLTTVLKERFPELGGAKIAKWWGGWIGLTANFLPKVGAEKRHSNILHGLGFNGHGVPQATMTGTILADRITGTDNPHIDLFANKGLSWPPEPISWVAGKALMGFMGAMDTRIDRKVRLSA